METLDNPNSESGRRQTPSFFVPAKRFVPLTAREKTVSVGKPEDDQIVPLSVERKIPPNPPAKRFVLLTAKELTIGFVKPVLTAVQLVPALVVRKMPDPPEKRFVPMTASASM